MAGPLLRSCHSHRGTEIARRCPQPEKPRSGFRPTAHLFPSIPNPDIPPSFPRRLRPARPDRPFSNSESPPEPTLRAVHSDKFPWAHLRSCTLLSVPPFLALAHVPCSSAIACPGARVSSLHLLRVSYFFLNHNLPETREERWTLSELEKSTKTRWSRLRHDPQVLPQRLGILALSLHLPQANLRFSVRC